MDHRKPAEVFPPGEFINDELQARGWSQIELAEVLGRPPRLVSELISGKRAITPETAKGLGAAFSTGPQLWMNLERDYRLANALHDDASVSRRSRLYEKTPVKEMVKRGWVEPSENVEVLERRVLDFLHIKDLSEEPWVAHAARRAGNQGISSAQWAWLFRVKQLANATTVPSYSPHALRSALMTLETLLIAPEEVRHVPTILAGCGVRFVLVEKLPQANIDGVCCWINESCPVIGMSLRRDKIDNFWFVLRHEIEHVLLGHGKDQAVIDDLEGDSAGTGPSVSDDERLANIAASNFCAPTEKIESFLIRKKPFYYEKDVVALSRLLNRHPGLVVGQMQFRLNNYSYLTKHLVKVKNFIVQAAMSDGWGNVMPV